MFESLSEKLQAVFRRLGGKGRLTEKDIDEALREVRLALLEADVNFKVVRDFLAQVRTRAVGAEVLESLSPAQQVIKVVYEELTSVLGGPTSGLKMASTPPTVILMVGLQGSGKTTTAAKLALHLQRAGRRPLLVAADLRRPAAVEQLAVLGRQLDIPVHRGDSNAVVVAASARRRAEEVAASVVLVDTGGRLHIDEEMMAELGEVSKAVAPNEILLVADAMTGQDAVRVAQDFHARVPLTGLILTKMDGDARGGAALSMRAVTGVPIKFIGIGEKIDALEPFHPERLASRILGMGDVLTLIEKAQEAVGEKKARELEKKVRQATFDLQDFLEQLRQVKKMGSLANLLEMVPGGSHLTKRLPQAALDDNQLKRVEAIILSMTPQERRHPEVLGGSRRRRVARGSGTTPQDVNQLLNQFRQAQQLMKQLTARKSRLPFPFPKL